MKFYPKVTLFLEMIITPKEELGVMLAVEDNTSKMIDKHDSLEAIVVSVLCTNIKHEHHYFILFVINVPPKAEYLS